VNERFVKSQLDRQPEASPSWSAILQKSAIAVFKFDYIGEIYTFLANALERLGEMAATGRPTRW